MNGVIIRFLFSAVLVFSFLGYADETETNVRKTTEDKQVVTTIAGENSDSNSRLSFIKFFIKKGEMACKYENYSRALSAFETAKKELEAIKDQTPEVKKTIVLVDSKMTELYTDWELSLVEKIKTITQKEIDSCVLISKYIPTRAPELDNMVDVFQDYSKKVENLCQNNDIKAQVKVESLQEIIKDIEKYKKENLNNLAIPEDIQKAIDKDKSERSDKVILLRLRVARALRSKDYQKAETFYDEILELDPGNQQALDGKKQVQEALRNESQEKTVLDKKELPYEIKVLLAQSRIYLEYKKYKDARDYCDRVLELDPGNEEALNIKKQIYESLYKEAEEKIKQVRKEPIY